MSDVSYTIKSPLIRRLLRAGMRTAFAMLRIHWRLTQPRTRGASAFCLTPEGRLILVQSTYEPGWNLPGGGIGKDETPDRAVVRELKEELGLISFSNIVFAFEMQHRPNFKLDTESVFVITDARMKGASSIEIERIGCFTPENIPPEISVELRQRLALLAHHGPTHPHGELTMLAERLSLTLATDDRSEAD